MLKYVPAAAIVFPQPSCWLVKPYVLRWGKIASPQPEQERILPLLLEGRCGLAPPSRRSARDLFTPAGMLEARTLEPEGRCDGLVTSSARRRGPPRGITISTPSSDSRVSSGRRSFPAQLPATIFPSTRLCRRLCRLRLAVMIVACIESVAHLRKPSRSPRTPRAELGPWTKTTLELIHN